MDLHTIGEMDYYIKYSQAKDCLKAQLHFLTTLLQRNIKCDLHKIIKRRKCKIKLFCICGMLDIQIQELSLSFMYSPVRYNAFNKINPVVSYYVSLFIICRSRCRFIFIILSTFMLSSEQLIGTTLSTEVLEEEDNHCLNFCTFWISVLHYWCYQSLL